MQDIRLAIEESYFYSCNNKKLLTAALIFHVGLSAFQIENHVARRVKMISLERQ